MARVGTFLVGQAVVEESGCFADAVCGTPVCNDAICGTWWACPPSGGLALGGVAPTVTISVPYVSAAGLGLGALKPTTIYTLAAPTAGLGLGAVVPAVLISTYVYPPAAGFGLGAIVPDRAGRLWLIPTECLPIDLPLAPEEQLVLAPAPEEELVLVAAECR